MVQFLGGRSLAAARDNAPAPPPASSTMSASSVTLPLDIRAPRPTIEISINGQGPFLFVLDTAAQGLVINADLATELGLPVIGQAAMGDPSDPYAVEVDRVQIDRIDVGAVRLSDVVADSWTPPAEIAQHLPGRGIFGLSLLSAFLVTFDYPSSRIVIEEGSLSSADEGQAVPWAVSGDGLPTVAITIADQVFDAHLDSGAPGGITLPENVRGKFQYNSDPVVVGRGRTVNSEFEIWRGVLDGTFRLGKHVRENPELHFMSMLNTTGNANLGSNFLRGFAVTFDARASLVRFTMNRDAPADPIRAH